MIQMEMLGTTRIHQEMQGTVRILLEMWEDSQETDGDARLNQDTAGDSGIQSGYSLGHRGTVSMVLDI
jgi:hypothetical protein